MDQLEQNHTVEVPQNLIDNELKTISDKPNSNGENKSICDLVKYVIENINAEIKN